MGCLQAEGWACPSLGMSHSSCWAVNIGGGGPSLPSDRVVGGGCGGESIGGKKKQKTTANLYTGINQKLVAFLPGTRSRN